MRHACVLAVSCSVLFALANVAVAQQIPPPESSPPANSPPFIALSPDQISELETWLSAMEKWRQYRREMAQPPGARWMGADRCA